MDPVSAENESNYVINPSVDVIRATLNVTQTRVLLQTESHPGGDFRITVNDLKDKAGTPNTIPANSYADYSYVPPDITPPQLSRAVIHGSDVVELIFDESLDRTSSETESNYQITPSVNILNATLVGDSLNRIFLETETHQSGQNYLLTVNGIADRATVPNVIPHGTQISYSYVAEDQTPPNLSSMELQGDCLIRLVFNESLDQASVEDTANYRIVPFNKVEEATLDASLSKVFLKTGRHQAGANYTLTVQGIKDRSVSSNVMGAENRPYSCVSQDIISPRLIRAEPHGNQMLELSFSEPLEPVSARHAGNYTIDNGISVQDVSISQSQMEVFLHT
ncbi:hypothetical protein KA005_51640, partial [bacterium]|nr:hypothetical protein [bacterium]